MTRCFIPNCNGPSRKNSASFFPFPKKADIRLQWIESLGLVEDQVRLGALVCQRHFNADDLVKSSRGRRHLKPGAVPVRKTKRKPQSEVTNSSEKSQEESLSCKSSASKEMPEAVSSEVKKSDETSSKKPKNPKKAQKVTTRIDPGTAVANDRNIQESGKTRKRNPTTTNHGGAKSNRKSAKLGPTPNLKPYRSSKSGNNYVLVKEEILEESVHDQHAPRPDIDPPQASVDISQMESDDTNARFCTNMPCVKTLSEYRCLRHELVAHERKSSCLQRTIEESQEQLYLIQEAIANHDEQIDQETRTIKPPCGFCFTSRVHVRNLYAQSVIREEMLRAKLSVLENEEEILKRLIIEGPNVFSTLFSAEEVKELNTIPINAQHDNETKKD